MNINPEFGNEEETVSIWFVPAVPPENIEIVFEVDPAYLKEFFGADDPAIKD